MMQISSLLLALACGCANAGKAAPGDAGAGSDAGPIEPMARAGHGFVAGGVVAKSASYTLIGTLTSGQGTSSSANYTQRAGVLGATQP